MALDGPSNALWLWQTQASVRGQAATYNCKSGAFAGQSLAGLTVVPGQSLLNLGSGNDQRIVRTDSDFLVQASTLVFGGQPYLPKRGDTIVTTIAGQSETFEVRPYGLENLWKWEDQWQVIMRILTHFLGAVL